MLNAGWGTAKRLAMVTTAMAVALAATDCARVAVESPGTLATWTASALAARSAPVVQSLDDLVQDDDDTELTAQRANPMVAFGFSGTPEQTQAMAAVAPLNDRPAASPAAGASTPATATPAGLPPELGLAPAPDADPMVAAATNEWNRAYQQGFFQSSRRPHLMTNVPVPSQDANQPGTSDGGIAAAVGGVAKVGWVMHPHLALIADIRVAPHLLGVAISDNDPTKDIETVILHEGWHAEAFQSPDLNRFNGALLQHNDQAAMFWKAATWSANRITYKEVAAREPELSQRLHNVGPNLSNMFEEAGADTAAFVIQAHDKSKDEWTQRLLHVEGTRAHAGIYAVAYSDPHETQESLAILANLGYDKLHALTADQSRALIDAVAADGSMLAAAKQGWLPQAQALADAADTLGPLDPASFSAATGALLAQTYDQMKPSALQWAQTPAADRATIAKATVQTVQGLWEHGGRLDYSNIAPGLVVDLPGHGPAPSYEVDPVKAAQAAGHPLSAQEQREVSSRRNVQALQEWADMARTLNASPSQVADLGNTEPFRMMTLWTTPTDRDALAQDKVWGADIQTFTARLDAMMAARASASPAQTVAAAAPSRKPGS